jgi:hypothetical protein
VAASEPGVEAMLGELHATLARKRGPATELREAPTALRIFVALGAVVLVVLFHVAWRRRPDLGVYPMDALLVAVVSSGLLLGAALVVGLRPLQRSPLPRWQRYTLVAAALALPVILATRPRVHRDHALSLGGANFWEQAAACGSYGLLLALPLLVVCWALDRGEHRSLPNALLAAGAAGISANLALELHCPITDPLHLVAGHASIGIVLVIGYALLRVARARG